MVTAVGQTTFTRITNGPIASDTEKSWSCSLVDYDNDLTFWR